MNFIIFVSSHSFVKIFLALFVFLNRKLAISFEEINGIHSKCRSFNRVFRNGCSAINNYVA